MRIVFTEDEVKSILKEFVRMAYGLSEKDVASVSYDYTKPTTSGVNREVVGVHVFVNTKDARPESWESYTYRDAKKK